MRKRTPRPAKTRVPPNADAESILSSLVDIIFRAAGGEEMAEVQFKAIMKMARPAKFEFHPLYSGNGSGYNQNRLDNSRFAGGLNHE